MKTNYMLLIVLCSATSGWAAPNSFDCLGDLEENQREAVRALLRKAQDAGETVVRELKSILGMNTKISTPIVPPTHLTTQAAVSKDISTISSYRTIISFDHLKQFAQNNKIELGGVVAVVLVGGTLYVMYQNGTLESLVDWAIDHPRATLLVTFTSGFVTAFAVAKYLQLPLPMPLMIKDMLKR
jgi:hypothetical protein